MERHTGKYQIEIEFTISEQNAYGHIIGSGSIHYKKDLDVKNLAEMGEVLQKIEEIT